MAVSVNISLDSFCAGGGHATLNVAVDGGQVRKMAFDADELRGALTEAERDDLIALLVRAKLAGLTRVQARNTLQSGFTVTL